MSSRSGVNVTPTLGSALPVRTGVGAPEETVTASERAPMPATMLMSEAVDYSVVYYKTKYADCFDVRGLNAMFSDGLR